MGFIPFRGRADGPPELPARAGVKCVVVPWLGVHSAVIALAILRLPSVDSSGRAGAHTAAAAPGAKRGPKGGGSRVAAVCFGSMLVSVAL